MGSRRLARETWQHTSEGLFVSVLWSSDLERLTKRSQDEAAVARGCAGASVGPLFPTSESRKTRVYLHWRVPTSCCLVYLFSSDTTAVPASSRHRIQYGSSQCHVFSIKPCDAQEPCWLRQHHQPNRAQAPETGLSVQCHLRRSVVLDASFCNSAHRRTGQTGLGKSTLINTIFASHLIDSKGRLTPSEPVRSTTEIQAVSHGTLCLR